MAAATTTANSAASCSAIAPFYWEVGDKTGTKVSGTVGGSTYTASTQMSIASASKWLYAAYVVEKKASSLSAQDIKYLNFRSGYTDFSFCLPSNTVGECATRANNAVYSAADDGFFSYGGGHMQQHAVLMGLGGLGNAGLATEMQTMLGSDVGILYSQPQPAGGVVSSASSYATFLRKLLNGQLQMASQLGSNPVCTNPLTCATAKSTPVPSSETWHYSLGHWVEDDPAVGDGAFSSAGAFGFYPWIDASKSLYGVLAREDKQTSGAGFNSADCGRLIRKAWFSATAQSN